MNHNLSVSKSITIYAPLPKIWEGLTNPEIIKQYLFGTQTVTDWKVGSAVIFQGEYNGQQYKDKGVIVENILHKKISYTYWSSFFGLEDKPENYSIVTYTLTPINITQTSLTWTMKGFANEAGQKHSESGMDDFLKKIKEVIER